MIFGPSIAGAETPPGALTALKAQLDDDMRKLIAEVGLLLAIELRLSRRFHRDSCGD